jgi:hypothetical protein
MRPRYVLSALLGSLAIALHFGTEYGLAVAALAILVLPSASRPMSGFVERARAAVEAAWRRASADDRRQAAAALVMPVAVVGLGVGVGLATSAGWGMVASFGLMVLLSAYVDLAS